MAIYSLRQSYISAGSGRSAVEAAAYRHSAFIESDRTGKPTDYRSKKGTVHSEVTLPLNAPTWVRDALSIADGELGLTVTGKDAVYAAGRLWNAVEGFETRKDAQFARETLVALPAELSRGENIELVREFVAEHMSAKGYIVDWVYHDPDKDQRNPHAHILTTLRPLSEIGFGAKTAALLDTDGEVVRTKKGAVCYKSWAGGKDELLFWREGWGQHVNAALARAGHDVQVTHLSFADQGIGDRNPTRHHGRSTYLDQRSQQAAIVAADVVERAKTFANFRGDPSLVLKAITAQQSTFDDRDIARTIHRYAGPNDDFHSLRLRVGLCQELMVVQPELHVPETNKIVQHARYTTVEVLEREARMIRSARSLFSHVTFDPNPAVIDREFMRSQASQGFGYTAEQRAAIDRLVEREGVSVMVGFAGAGKSTVLRAVGSIYEADGRRVIGGALAGKAAEGLQNSSGIASRTLASWELSWNNGFEHLRRGDVFVMDEAGMVASAQMDRILMRLDEWNAKVVLVGDSRQLQPIEAGAAFRAVANEVGYVELNEVRRQLEPWQAEAAVAFGRGEAAEGLAAYDNAGAILMHEDRDGARSAVIEGWRSDWRAGADVAMLAHTNLDIQALNTMARDSIKADGGLVEDFSFLTARGQRDFAVGDHVLFLQNSRDLGVKNGTMGTVLVAQKGRLTIEVAHLVDPVRIDQADYGHVDHGYAQTIHKSQGQTIDRTHVLATGMMDAQLSYVAMTRHREETVMHVAVDTFTHPRATQPASREEIFERLSRDGLKDTTLEYERTVDYGQSIVDAERLRDARSRQGLDRFLDLRGLPNPADVLHAINAKFEQIRKTLMPSRSKEADTIRVERAPLVPKLPEYFAPIIARLDYVQAHSDAMGGEGNARRHAFAYAENALHRAPTAQRLLEWSQDVSDIVAPATVLAIGRNFDETKADRLLADLRPETRTSLKENWQAVHAMSRASSDVGLLDTAYRVHSSHRAELEAERIEKEYRAGIDREIGKTEIVLDADASPRAQGGAVDLKERAPTPTTMPMQDAQREQSFPTPHVQQRGSSLVLLPAVQTWPETVAQEVARQLLADESIQAYESDLSKRTGLIWRESVPVWNGFRAQAATGNLGKIQLDIQTTPEKFGELQGQNRLLRGPDANRERAIRELSPFASLLGNFAAAYPLTETAIHKRELDWRYRNSQELPGLSEDARHFAHEVARGERALSAGHLDEAGEILKIVIAQPNTQDELAAWLKIADQRFPGDRTVSELPGIDPKMATYLDTLREDARTTVPFAERYRTARVHERSLEIDRSLGIEREGIGRSR